MNLAHQTWPHTRAAVVDRIKAASDSTLLAADVMLSADRGELPLFVPRLIRSHLEQRAPRRSDLDSPIDSALRHIVQLRFNDTKDAMAERQAAFEFLKVCGAFDKMARAVLLLHAIETLLETVSARQ
jgi:hypothetical protein